VTVIVVMPSRGRPDRAKVALEALIEHQALPDTELWLAVDHDDPRLDEYVRNTPSDANLLVLDDVQTGNLVRATNTVSLDLAANRPSSIIGNLGDDHVCRTPAWDRLVVDALTKPGIAYGDDLFQSERLPTAPFISAAIVNALGWYALPSLEHLFIDNVWRDVGAQTGRLHYLPDLVIEHVHPLAGKAKWDSGYVKVNKKPAVDRDADAYHAWRDSSMNDDVDRVRRYLNGG